MINKAKNRQNKKKAYLGRVVEVGELDVTLFRELLSIDAVLVEYPFSKEFPRVRVPRDGGFETLEERG